MMRNSLMFESLEPRDLFSSVVTTIGETSGLIAAAARPVIVARPGTIYLNAVTSTNTATANSSNPSSNGGPNTATYQLRVYNKGAARLLIPAWSIKIEGVDKSLFKITAGYDPTTGVSMAIGKQLNITVEFDANDVVGIKNADIRIASSDPKHPVVKIPLRGLVTAGEGTTYEPSLQTIFDLYNLNLNAGEVINSANPYFVPATTSDELDIQTLVKADATQDVSVVPLAEFTNHATPDVRMGFYTPGLLDSEKYVWYSPSDSSQSVSPSVFGQTSFDPGTAAFGLVTQYPYFTNTGSTVTTANNKVRNVYSENALNKTWDNTSLVHMKFYPYKDANGNVVANTYIVAEEEYSQDSVSDSQDLVYIVSNVKPADTTPTLSYENLTGYPSNDTMAFNIVQNPDTNYANITRLSNTLRLRNTSSVPLTVSLAVDGDYTISSGAGTNVVIAAGASRDVKITFTATSGTAVHVGHLVITSDDPTKPTTSITLNGNWQDYSEQTPDSSHIYQEPTVEKIVNDLMGYQTVFTTGSQTLNNNGIVTLTGEEIGAEYFQTADTNAPVSVTELATFHNQTYTDSGGTTHPTNSNIAWYTQGSPSQGLTQKILVDEPGEGQMILPTTNGNSSTTATNGVSVGGVFRPGAATFGFVVEPTATSGEYSDHILNPWPNSGTAPANYGQFLRFFPMRDENGKLVPNTYIVLHDYDKTYSNFDFQDNIYIVSNIMPANAMKTPRTVYAESTAQGNTINYTSPDDGPKVYGFNVYRSDTATGVFTLLNNTPLARQSSGSYSDTTAVAGTTYYYEVTTVGNGGVESAPYTVKVN